MITLNRAVKLCYRATSLISTLRDIAPLYRGPGAALLTYTSLVLGQASNLLLRYQNCYRAAQSEMDSPGDAALIDPEYQVADMVSICSHAGSFPFVVYPQNMEEEQASFNKNFRDFQREELRREVQVFAFSQLKQRDFRIRIAETGEMTL